jgi:hypothetical protein
VLENVRAFERTWTVKVDDGVASVHEPSARVTAASGG